MWLLWRCCQLPTGNCLLSHSAAAHGSLGISEGLLLPAEASQCCWTCLKACVHVVMHHAYDMLHDVPAAAAAMLLAPGFNPGQAACTNFC